jgi:hypothetical protein
MSKRLIVTAVMVSLAACAAPAQTPQPTPAPTSMPTTAAGVVDMASLVDALNANGASVHLMDPLIGTALGDKEYGLTVNGENLQVYDYADASTARAAAATVSKDGTQVAGTAMDWSGDPHLYPAGHIIVVYTGSDQLVMDALSAVMGPQFAGK